MVSESAGANSLGKRLLPRWFAYVVLFPGLQAFNCDMVVVCRRRAIRHRFIGRRREAQVLRRRAERDGGFLKLAVCVPAHRHGPRASIGQPELHW